MASILLAFGIDAWWDNRGLRTEEQRAVQDLTEDFEQNLESLQSNTSHHRNSLDAGEHLLRIIHGDEPIPSRPLLDTLVMRSFIDQVTYDPRSAVLDDLLASGRLGILQDDVLRTTLASWPTVLEDYKEEEMMILRLVESTLLPFVTSRVPTADLYNAAHAGFGTYPPSLHEPDFRALLGDVEFESHLANRLAQEHVALRDIDRNVGPTLQLILERLRLASR